MIKRASLPGGLLGALVLLIGLWSLLSSAGSMAVPDPQQAPPTADAEDPAAIGAAVFPHDEHVEDFEIDCVECHHETNAAPLRFPHEDYFDDFWIDCRICHHEQAPDAMGPRACSECHHTSNGNIADQTLSAKVVIHKNCWECHDTGTGAEASAACTDCHQD